MTRSAPIGIFNATPSYMVENQYEPKSGFNLNFDLSQGEGAGLTGKSWVNLTKPIKQALENVLARHKWAGKAARRKYSLEYNLGHHIGIFGIAAGSFTVLFSIWTAIAVKMCSDRQFISGETMRTAMPFLFSLAKVGACMFLYFPFAVLPQHIYNMLKANVQVNMIVEEV